MNKSKRRSFDCVWRKERAKLRSDDSILGGIIRCDENGAGKDFQWDNLIANCSTTRIDFILRNSAARVQSFLERCEESALVLSYPRQG